MIRQSECSVAIVKSMKAVAGIGQRRKKASTQGALAGNYDNDGMCVNRHVGAHKLVFLFIQTSRHEAQDEEWFPNLRAPSTRHDGRRAMHVCSVLHHDITVRTTSDEPPT